MPAEFLCGKNGWLDLLFCTEQGKNVLDLLGEYFIPSQSVCVCLCMQQMFICSPQLNQLPSTSEKDFLSVSLPLSGSKQDLLKVFVQTSPKILKFAHYLWKLSRDQVSFSWWMEGNWF